MTTRWILTVGCVALLAVSFGCAKAFTPERMTMREYSVRRDTDRMVDDVDWLLGLEDPSNLYRDSLPPGP